MEKEVLKAIPNYEGLYEASDFGRIKSLNYNHTGNPKFLKLYKDKDGYNCVTLCKEGKKKPYKVYRIVLNTFVGESLLQINHKDGIKANDRLENLEYCTCQENALHAFRLGLRKSPLYWEGKFGKDNASSKKVGQYTKDGKLIKIWENARCIYRELKIDFRYVSAVCLGKRKTTSGFIFNFI